jgi:squalene-hopene/tetraprenyl-beta-curcumene cyclase
MNLPGLDETLRQARRSLLAARTGAGHWEGWLSSSALSTATAVVALSLVDKERFGGQIQAGCDWLARSQNEDGGWGDTLKSHSNLSTTLLCWSALTWARPDFGTGLSAAEGWITQCAGGTDPETIVRKVTDRYGKDRTFAVPILMTCAICGRLGASHEAWRRVLPLPFELAALPREWFATLQLPVVSYALPALIAIGFARNFHAPPPVWGRVRAWVWPKVSRLLEQIQPSSGGFLEAAPLTSFVTMALASTGLREHAVVQRGVDFLRREQRSDGSWPIDTNLATWVTTLAVKALLSNETQALDFAPQDRSTVRDWLLAQQYQDVHPFTGAAPGGWAWTDLPGGVPDADDTPGALIALWQLSRGTNEPEILLAAKRGIIWLLDLQNRDGGIPTFCRGWGALPFDRSSPDLTAHGLRAWNAWKDAVSPALRTRLNRAATSALLYLERVREPEGTWVPLWFGNQHERDESNRTYGTAKVLLALAEVGGWLPRARELAKEGVEWLLRQQHDDGGWGGGVSHALASIEETALALEALVTAGGDTVKQRQAIQRGVAFLVERTKGGTEFAESPIGLYFAKLWYFERLYPLIWSVSALERVASAARVRRTGITS